MYKLSDRSKSNMSGVSQDLIRIAERAIELTKIDFGIPESGGLRTENQQKSLYDKGLSKADGIKRLSTHQSGTALDFYAYVDGAGSWKPEHLAQIACAFMQAAIELDVKIRWGGLFKSFVDMPHVELLK